MCSTTTPTSGAGAKFAAADLIGIPWQILVGPEGARRRQGRDQAAQRRRARESECRPTSSLGLPREGLSTDGRRERSDASRPHLTARIRVKIERMDETDERADPDRTLSRHSSGCCRCAICGRAARKGFISVIAGFSFLGIMLGVATLIIVMAVMNGFRKELLDKILGLNGHLLVQPLESPLTDWKDVAERISQVVGHPAGGAGRRRPGARVLALQRLGRAGARHPRRRPQQPHLDRQEHQAGLAGRFRRGAGRRHRHAGSPINCRCMPATASRWWRRAAP